MADKLRVVLRDELATAISALFGDFGVVISPSKDAPPPVCRRGQQRPIEGAVVKPGDIVFLYRSRREEHG